MKEVSEILSPQKRKLKRLVSMLKAKARGVDFDLRRLPARAEDGSGRHYVVLLDKDELDIAVEKP